ncbi:unnamed protein product [Sphagnum balticum]
MFGKYILLDKVAAGGMAEVYRVKAPGAEGIGKILAIKRILPQFSSQSEFIDMFKTEAKIAINLTQANISQIYEFGVEQDQFFLLMEYIDGRNLRQVLSRCTKAQKALTIEQCVYIISQVSTGLDYAHRCIDKDTGTALNIIHRDMSPQNIMITYEGEVKIVDFGIAKAESKIEVTRAGTLKGKFGYMSPEQAEGLELDARTDIFSIGIVLWELLSGERLFVANSEVNTIRKIKECQIPSLRKINPHIHEELERISMKALAKDRNLRYQTCAELHRDLSRFLYRVNPEFTSHDLAIAVKGLFKEDILEDRKKSIEFAKISFAQFAKPKPNEDTAGPSIHTQTETKEVEVRMQSQTGQTEKSLNAGLQNIATDFKLESEKPDNRLEMIKTSVRHDEQHTRVQTALSQINGRRTQHSGSFSMARQPSRLPGLVRSALPAILIVLSLSAMGLIIRKNSKSIEDFANKTMSNFTVKDEANQKTEGSLDPNQEANLGTAPPPTPIKAKVMLRSIPAGATIEVDGEAVGTTPSEFSLNMNQEVVLSLKREGYVPYVQDFRALKSPEDLTMKLVKAPVGYLNIDVSPTTADIYINNQRLGEKLPISHYPVLADTKLVVRAYNKNVGTFDEQTVMLHPDTVKSITFFLRKSK